MERASSAAGAVSCTCSSSKTRTSRPCSCRTSSRTAAGSLGAAGGGSPLPRARQQAACRPGACRKSNFKRVAMMKYNSNIICIDSLLAGCVLDNSLKSAEANSSSFSELTPRKTRRLGACRQIVQHAPRVSRLPLGRWRSAERRQVAWARRAWQENPGPVPRHLPGRRGPTQNRSPAGRGR